MPLPRESRTYRVQQLPVYVRISQVAEFLAAACEGIGLAENINVYSAARSLNVTFATRATNTATITFKQTPPIFDNDEEQWSVPSCKPGWNRNLVFDTHFRGLTALNDVAPNEQKLDCIAISGLASHPFGSWKHRGSHSNFMWLRDQLPMDLPFVRSIIYGYDTRLVDSKSFKGINDLGSALIEDLRTIRKSISDAVIFLAHSLGGIVLKRAMANIANSGTGEDQLLEKIQMICFFGVPSQGMHNKHLLAMVEGQPNQELVKSLSSEAGYLPELDIQFSGLAVLRTIRFISIYETKKSLTTKEVQPGVWRRSEPYEILVEKNSAIQRGTSQLDSIPVDEDHSNLVKFAENDQAYQNICNRIAEAQSIRIKADVQDIVDNIAAASANIENEKELDLQRLLGTLNFADMNKRQADIERAYTNTFGWVYEHSDIKFISWLRGDGSIFWIRGKPGSGKSTLMKYLHDSEEISLLSKGWKPQTKIICCWFFFYARGSFIQKSFDGLLHSILYQILMEEPRLADMILPLYLQRSGIGALRGASTVHRAIWPFEDLIAAFDIILQQTIFPLRLYLFLDALDEYDGRPQLIADFLKSTTTLRSNATTQVKVCFSSRPSSVFINNFDSCPGFSIQQYTKQDIWRYTENQLKTQFTFRTDYANSDSSAFADVLEDTTTDLETKDVASEIAELTLAVVEKARGVFLWVRLVMNEFLKNAADGATLDELHEFLLTMPEEIEEFFLMIIQKIRDVYRLEGYFMMEILLRSDRELDLSNFAGACLCAPCTTIEHCISKLQIMKKAFFHHALKLKIESRCGGLVEVLDSETRSPTVQFMHETVREFVSKPNFRQRILGDTGMSDRQNGHSILAKYYLSLTSIRRPCGFHVGLSMLHARLSEWTTGLSQIGFLNSIDAKTFNSWTWRRYVDDYRPDTVLGMAVTADLRLYVGEVLKRRPIFIKMQPQMSLLHAAVQHTMVNQEQEPTYMHAASTASSGGMPTDSLGPMCTILLDLGCSLQTEYQGWTPFEWLFQQYWEFLSDHKITGPSQAMYEVAEAFLRAGQNPDVNIFKLRLSETKFCKPLHISQFKLTALLIRHKAAVNALDSLGRTALDLVVAQTNMRKPAFGMAEKAEEAEERVVCRTSKKTLSRRADEIFETTMLLLDNGGSITTYGQQRLPTFLSELKKFYSVPENFKIMPYVQVSALAVPLRPKPPDKPPRLSRLSMSTLADPDIGTPNHARSSSHS